jgi:hypothetical protein
MCGKFGFGGCIQVYYVCMVVQKNGLYICLPRLAKHADNALKFAYSGKARNYKMFYKNEVLPVRIPFVE